MDVFLHDVRRSAGRKAPGDGDRNGTRVVPPVAVRQDERVDEVHRARGAIGAAHGQPAAGGLESEVGAGAGVPAPGGG